MPDTTPRDLAGIVSIVNAVLLAAGLARLGDKWSVGTRLAWVGLPMLVLNPLLASSLGLETMLTVTTTVWLLERSAAGDRRGFGWLAGVAAVLRPDLAVVVVVCWLGHSELRIRNDTGDGVALRLTTHLGQLWEIVWRAAVVGLPWYIFSWIYFGSAIPDTLVIKQTQSWGSYSHGLTTRLHHLFPAAVDATLVFAAIGLVVMVTTPFLMRVYPRTARRVAIGGLPGVAYYAAYVALNVPPYFWYYGVPVAALTLVAAWGVAAYSQTFDSSASKAFARVVCCAMAVAILSPTLVSWGTSLASNSPLRQAPIMENWALASQYKKIGLSLARHIPAGTTIRSGGEFGTLLYYCDCSLLDRFDNRALIMPELRTARRGSPLMALNYTFLDPADYPPIREKLHLVHLPLHSQRPDVWNTWSPTQGPGHYVLLPGPRPADIGHGALR